MLGNGPIRISQDEWVIIRNNPRFPAAVIRRLHPGTELEHYRVVTFDLDPEKRRLLGRFTTLESADRAVRFTVSPDAVPAVLNRHGAYDKQPPQKREETP